MFLVARTYTDQKDQISLMSERFHTTIETALEDYNTRFSRGEHDLCIAKVLQVKTVLVDFDISGSIEYSLPDRSAELT